MTEQDSCYPTCRHLKATLVRAMDRTPEGVAIAPADDASLSSRSAAEGSAFPTAEPTSQPESNDEFTGNPNQ